jgi:Sigma-70, region 4
MDISILKGLDIPSISWGHPPAPLLPKSLRQAWRSDVLPKWVCTVTGIPIGSTLESLGPTVWDNMKQITPRLEHFLIFQVRSRSSTIKDLKCFDRNWPLGLKSADILWTARTRNCLSKQGLLAIESDLVKLTFNDLFGLEGMGAKSILDFSSTLEAAMEFYDKMVSSYVVSATAINAQSNHAGDQPKPDNVSLTDMDRVDHMRTLERAAGADWAEQVSEQDPRFKHLLPPGQGTLSDRIENLVSEPTIVGNVGSLPALVSSIKKIEEYINHAKHYSLEHCLVEFVRLLSRTEKDRLEVLAARFGWNGEEPQTLEACGQRLGVTRERIRQIQALIIGRIPKHAVFMPQLDQALSAVEKRTPLKLADAARLLREMGISERDFHPAGLLEASALLGRETILSISETRTGEKMVTRQSEARMLRLIPKLARRVASKAGVTSVFQVQEAAQEQGSKVTEAQVRENVRGGNFDFLDDDWFWAPDVKYSRNRLHNLTRKLLSVASPQDVLTLRDGIRRAYKWRRLTAMRYRNLTVPPTRILLEFYRRCPGFRVETEMIHASEPFDPKKELSDVDYVFVEVLRSSPSGILDRDSLAAACLTRGMNENTFNVYTSYSPILEHVDVNIWKLRGIKVDPTAVEAMRIANHLRPKQRRVLQFGWGKNGALWLAARVPKLGGSMIIGCPGPIRRFLDGQQFACKSKEGNQDCGTITINDRGTSYGYGQFMRRYGVDENDVFLAEFDLNEQTVTLSVVDDEILDDLD